MYRILRFFLENLFFGHNCKQRSKRLLRLCLKKAVNCSILHQNL